MYYGVRSNKPAIPMKRFIQIAPIVVVLLPLLVLQPIGQVMYEWYEYAQIVPPDAMEVSERGFDWVFWQDAEGPIVAEYVFPNGPASKAGIRKGDIFFSLDDQQYFNAEQLREAIEGISPGSEHVFVVLRGEERRAESIPVPFTRYPTFLYPLSASLWRFSIWGFTLAAFFHVLGLLIIVPVAVRSRRPSRARYSLILILSSSLWIFGNWIRLLLVEGVAPPGDTGSMYAILFHGLTFFSVAGWIGFPALLLRKVIGDTHLISVGRLGRIRYIIYLPVVVLGGLAVVSALQGEIGPFTLQSLVAPILFYACCYVAAAAALVFSLHVINPEEAEEQVGGWNRMGSAITLVVALLMALLVRDVLPLIGPVPDMTAGWLIVFAQLLSLAPILLVSFATLRQGKMDQVLSRALVYLTVLGLIFFAFIGGLEIMQRYIEGFFVSRKILAGFFVVLLLILFERIGRRMRLFTEGAFLSERRLLRQRLSRFQEQMGQIMHLASLTQRTVQVVGEAFNARSLMFFIRPTDSASTWISSAYSPQAPYLTERIASRIWDEIEADGHIWAAVPELNESNLNAETEALLKQRGVALLVPVIVEDHLAGLLAFGPKKKNRATYNLEDLDIVRGLSGQLVLAIERLLLVEREKELIKVSAEAELKALRAQINPHFLFNALNTIIALIEETPDEAEEVVQHLAAIFRHILTTGSRTFVTLEEEMELVNNYLGIEQARFGDKLEVEQSLASPIALHPVPAFVIQTLVENAIKHGLEKKRGIGSLKIICRALADESVEVCIKDSGLGIPDLFNGKQGTEFYGIGLRNIATRMEKLYQSDDLLTIKSSPDEGTEVRIVFPKVTPNNEHHTHNVESLVH